MFLHDFLVRAALAGWLVSSCAGRATEPLMSSVKGKSGEQSFIARGVELEPGGRTALVSHEAITNYMDSMTMAFKVKEPEELTGLRVGDRISFRLYVTETESWIGQIAKIGSIGLTKGQPLARPDSEAMPEVKASSTRPMLAFKFTNELGRAVSLEDFRGQALAITFFFTRCPIPDYCPRLSKNFQEASSKLSSMAGGPTNWHFLSVSFDTEADNPRTLKAYGELYHYNPAHWSFLTGPADKISELARLSDVKFERDGGSFNHNFRTLIIDSTGHLQTVFPTGGNLSDAIVDEILKGTAVTPGVQISGQGN